jgi:cytochrome c-type protein NapB
MENPNKKLSRTYIPFAGACVFGIVFIIFSALSNLSHDLQAASPEALNQRTLNAYYARRQYPGAPPETPHPVTVHKKKLDCLMCHTDGGWTWILKRKTPVTPHPEQSSCMQCHVSPVTDALFRATDWRSIPPPRLGRSYLPDAPPPIPHYLQMRNNCIACHVGPGTIEAIRMQHPFRDMCRQCHVPDPPVQPFTR